MFNLLLMAAMFLVGAVVYFFVGFGALLVLFCYVPLTRRLGRLFPGGIKRARIGLSFGIEFACRAALCLGAAALELYFGGEFAAGGFISGAIMAFGLSVEQLNVRGRNAFKYLRRARRFVKPETCPDFAKVCLMFAQS